MILVHLKKVGNWVMKKEDIKGLSATQIAKKYSLPQVPNMITDVKILANQKNGSKYGK